MAKQDEWTIDKDEARNKLNEMKPKNTGVLCPRRNLTGNCSVCDGVKEFWNAPDNSPKKEAYRKYKTMGSFFFNAVLPEDPETILTVEVGWKAGTTIVNGMEDADKDWSNLHNPQANKGYALKIKKTEADGYPFYDTYADKGMIFDWDISKEVLNNIPDMSREAIAERVISGEMQNDKNYFHVKTLTKGQTITLRMLPNPKKKRTPPIEFLFRHWGGVTKEQVEGTEVFDPLKGVELDEKPSVEKSILDSGFDKVGSVKKPPCFGSEIHFDPNDDDCTKTCEFFKACGKLVNG